MVSFEETKKGCCLNGVVEALLCNQMSSFCEEADKFLFWDGVHVSEAGNLVAAKYIMDNIVGRYSFF
ncbi:hypothetical protein Tsubulata_024386 [Turnera subulata]|uniref:GDSL esterase/lipase n=1 Tax=Turnera subulata TaxID=218843 RepID=A0A9Q0F4B5_9ROSI|nr:hypothetical protein Tsubulata_024386 [Turnera subulata]